MNAKCMIYNRYENMNCMNRDHPERWIGPKTQKGFIRSYIHISIYYLLITRLCEKKAIPTAIPTLHKRRGEPKARRRTHLPPKHGRFTGKIAAVVALSHMPNHIRQDR